MEERDYKDEEKATEYWIDSDGITLIRVAPGTGETGAIDKTPETDHNIITAGEIFPLNYTPKGWNRNFESIYNIPQTLNHLIEEFNKLKKENNDIKRKLTEIAEKPEIIDILNLSDKIIEEIIVDYLKTHQDKDIFPSDIAFEYKLEAKKVFDICEKLKNEGKIL